MSQTSLFPKPEAGPAKELREYQADAVESVFDYFYEKTGHPLIVIPTGGGKSLVIADLIRQANVYFPPTRFIVLSHVAILFEQNAEELQAQWPESKISFYSDSLSQKDLSGDIIFAGIQSIYKKAFDLRHAPDMILIDECHLLPGDSDTMYRKFLDDMMIINPDIKVVGFTATPFRSNYGMLHKGKNALFTDIAYEVPIMKLIELHHLCPIVTPSEGIKTKMDVTGVKTRLGDYITSQLSAAVNKAEITKACVDEMMIHGADRKLWIVFTVDIQHCEHVRDEIRSRGISCEMVHSKQDDTINADIIRKYRAHEIRCLVNVSKLTTGFNVPAIDMMAFMRPMRSPVLYIQTAGRGMRIYPDKHNCLLLDFGGVVEELGPIDQIRIKDKKDGEGEAPMKLCENCGATVPAGCTICPVCANPFPEREHKIEDGASTAAVLSSQLKSTTKHVSGVNYYRHKKEGKPDSMRVDYLCGLDTYREWVCFDHTGYAREKACVWWDRRSTESDIGGPAPNSVTEALERARELRKPESIQVKRVGVYHEIIGYHFGEK